jgi:very-short-patch-repair endonuclease
VSLISRARALRISSTEAERRLWHKLRGRQLAGFKFRRQRPIGRYIVDFVCVEQKLVVELDGGQHAESARDRVRDAALAAAGYRVFRIWNSEVMETPDSELIRIAEALGVTIDP